MEPPVEKITRFREPGANSASLGCQLGRANCAHVCKGIGIGELLDLLGNCFGHLLLAEPNVGAPKSANGVEVSLAVYIFYECTITLFDEQCAFGLEGFEMLPGVQQMALIGLNEGLGFIVQRRGHDLFGHG